MRFEKVVYVGDDKFEVSILIAQNEENFLIKDVTVQINRFNQEKLFYIYKISKPVIGSYVDVIKEAIKEFKKDTHAKVLLNWDGVIDYNK